MFIPNEKMHFTVGNKILHVPFYYFRIVSDLFYEAMRNVEVIIFEEDKKIYAYSLFNQPIILTPKIKRLTFG